MGNIPSLNILSNDTIADVSPLNENFEELRVEVNDNDNRITNLRTQTSSSLTTIQNQMTKDKEELLEEISTTGGAKLNVDLSNIGEEAGTKIMDIIKPDYTAGYSISSGWQATETGWIYVRHRQSQDDQTITLKIDDVIVFQTGGGGGYSGGDVDCVHLFIGVGSTVSFSGKGSTTMMFFPCKGVK